MKKTFQNYFSKGGFALMFVMLVCAVFGVMDGGVLAADAAIAQGNYIPGDGDNAPPTTSGIGAGIQAPGEVLTTAIVKDMTDQILLSDYDKMIVEFRPEQTPFDTILRYVSQRPTKSLSVKWGQNDVKPMSTTTAAKYDVPTTPTETATLTLTNGKLFPKTGTIRVPSILGYEADGTTQSTNALQLYVQDRNYSLNTITVRAVNGPKATPTSPTTVPAIPAGTKLYRLGRAAGELDVQTEPYNALPTFDGNYCQSFKCQVELSKWFDKSKKNVEWDKRDMDDAAKYEYKREMEATHLYGTKGIVRDDSASDGKVKEVYLANGISSYIKGKYEYKTWDKKAIIALTQQAFTGNIGSKKRFLFAGSDLIAGISNVDYTQFKDITKDSETIFNLSVTTLKTAFGDIHIVHTPLMDEEGESTEGYLVDPQWIYKYTFENENTQDIDKAKLGQSNVDASITTEVSCVGVGYPACQLKVHYNASLT